MQILNLADPQNSVITYSKRKYPDGQQDIFIDATTDISKPICIDSRFNSFNDLELIICATKALRNLGSENINLYIPYLLGARSDRKFSDGGTSYLVQVVAPIINSLQFKKVWCLDAHSYVAAACVNSLENIPNIDFVTKILANKSNFHLVAPDKGAQDKVMNIAKAIGHDEIITCTKVREISTGKIKSVDVGHFCSAKGRDLYIVDDICDGGRTFIEVANKLKDFEPGCMHLIVTHGIFSNGFDELKKYFKTIYCTNSISEITEQPSFVIQSKVI